MSQFDSMYERTIRKLLKGHVESGVPSERDLWPTIRQRLSVRPETSGSGKAEEFVGRPSPTIDAQVTPVSKLGSGLKATLGIVGLALLLGITALSISRLAQRGDTMEPQPSTPLATPQAGDVPQESTRLFTIEDFNPPDSLSDVVGFDVDYDGSFWVVGLQKLLRHYSPDGKLLGTVDLAPTISRSIFVFEVHDGSLWIFADDTVHKLTYDGTPIHQYRPFYPLPGTYEDIPHENNRLIPGGDGQMLIEAGYGYVVVADQNPNAKGELEPPTLPGYPSNGKLYKKVQDRHDLLRVEAQGTSTISVEVGLSISETITDLHIFKVMPDNSFYVVVEATQYPSIGQSYYVRQYVMHFASDGALIERARLPDMERAYGWKLKQIAVGDDGSFYVTQMHYDMMGAPTQRVDILRLNFYPASDPLPPPPTPTITPIIPHPRTNCARPSHARPFR